MNVSKHLAPTALALVTALGCSGPATPPPTAETADTPADAAPALLIAYNVLDDPEADDYEVFVMNLDGSGRRNLTNHPAVDWVYRAWEDRLFLVSDRDEERRKYRLYELAADGGGWRRITEFRVRDSWLGVRRGGSELVVASSKDGAPDLYLVDRATGTVVERLTDDEHYDNDPTFSPEGSKVVWRTRRPPHPETDELWIRDLPTGESRRLTHYAGDLPASDRHSYRAGPPTWEPSRDLISFCAKSRGHNSIYTVRPDGSGLTQLTPDGTDQCWHDWSPDGRWLAYDGADGGGNYDIYLRDMESGETRRLTHGPETEQAPVFVRAPRAQEGPAD